MRRGPKKRITLGADKAYDDKDFVDTVRDLGVVPHVRPNNKNRRSAIDGRTTRHPGYAIEQSTSDSSTSAKSCSGG